VVVAVVVAVDGAVVGAVGVAVVGAVVFAVGDAWKGAVGDVVAVAVFVTLFLPCIALPSILLLTYGRLTAVIFFWAIVIAWVIGLFRWGKRRERQAQNPMQGLLELDQQPTPLLEQPAGGLRRLLAPFRRRNR
jgi:hypothetical protein